MEFFITLLLILFLYSANEKEMKIIYRKALSAR